MQSVLENRNQALINILDDCARVCNADVTADLMERDVERMVRCVRLDFDCAEICALTSKYLSRNSEFAYLMAVQCAVVCDACAQECEKHVDMAHCVESARICRKCAQECRKLRAS